MDIYFLGRTPQRTTGKTVTHAIASSEKYAGYQIDDADFVETPGGEYYLVELEKGELEVKVKVNAEGEFI